MRPTALFLLFGGLLSGCGEIADLVTNPLSSFDSPRQSSSQLVANQDYLPTVLRLLNEPGIESVDIIQFNFFTEYGGAPQAILDRLIALHQEGVRVRLVLEGHRQDPRTRNSATLKKLAQAGITDVHMTNTHTVHTKALCINGQKVLLGSTNWTKTSMERNNETNALIESATIGDAYTRYFEALLAGEEAMLPEVTADGDQAFITDSAYYDQLMQVIKSARHSLDIGTYFLAYRQGREAQDAKVKAVLDAVIDRHQQLSRLGVPFRVRFFLDNNGISPEHHQNFTVRAALYARNYLAAHGVTEVFFDRYEQISHCKFVIKDAGRPGAEVLFGSTNLYVGDFDDHHQTNIRSQNPQLIAAFARYMEDRLRTATREPVVPPQRGQQPIEE